MLPPPVTPCLVDDHFVPRRRRAGRQGLEQQRQGRTGRADTTSPRMTAAACFVTGELSGLTVTLPKALAELKKAAGPGAAIMVGFDRGGAHAQAFRHCREQDVHWVSYRRAPLAVPARLPVITTITRGGRTRQIAWAEETAQLKDYGQARQITLFEHGQVALQILTSDFDACPADILAWLKSRWRQENFLKYASENYGMTRSATTSPASRRKPRSLTTRTARKPTPPSAKQKRQWPPPSGTWPCCSPTRPSARPPRTPG